MTSEAICFCSASSRLPSRPWICVCRDLRSAILRRRAVRRRPADWRACPVPWHAHRGGAALGQAGQHVEFGGAVRASRPWPGRWRLAASAASGASLAPAACRIGGPPQQAAAWARAIWSRSPPLTASGPPRAPSPAAAGEMRLDRALTAYSSIRLVAQRAMRRARSDARARGFQTAGRGRKHAVRGLARHRRRRRASMRDGDAFAGRRQKRQFVDQAARAGRRALRAFRPHRLPSISACASNCRPW